SEMVPVVVLLAVFPSSSSLSLSLSLTHTHACTPAHIHVYTYRNGKGLCEKAKKAYLCACLAFVDYSKCFFFFFFFLFLCCPLSSFSLSCWTKWMEEALW